MPNNVKKLPITEEKLPNVEQQHFCKASPNIIVTKLNIVTKVEKFG